jgi:hypothetical protein
LSENNRFYVKKMAELRASRITNCPLHSQLEELLKFVQRCEAMREREYRLGH